MFQDALFVPDNSKNLIFVLKLREAGVDVSFGEKLNLFLLKSRSLWKLKMDFLCGKLFLVLMRIASMLTVYKCNMQKWDITVF